MTPWPYCAAPPSWPVSDECFAPRGRRKYGVGVRTTSALGADSGDGERTLTEWSWMGHWTMERAIRELDPFQGHAHVPLSAIARAPHRWLPDRNPCVRR